MLKKKTPLQHKTAQNFTQEKEKNMVLVSGGAGVFLINLLK